MLRHGLPQQLFRLAQLIESQQAIAGVGQVARVFGAKSGRGLISGQGFFLLALTKERFGLSKGAAGIVHLQSGALTLPGRVVELAQNRLMVQAESRLSECRHLSSPGGIPNLQQLALFAPPALLWTFLQLLQDTRASAQKLPPFEQLLNGGLAVDGLQHPLSLDLLLRNRRVLGQCLVHLVVRKKLRARVQRIRSV